jgi:hypothetical protein
MRWWLAVLVLAMACGAVVAAPPVDDAPLRGPLLEEAKRRLASPDSKVRAWGCYVVSRYEVEEAVPLVREVLRREARRKKPDQWLVHAGLEALIRLRVHVSNEELTPFVGHPRQLLMLALRDPAHYADTLFLIHDPQGGLDLWIATGQHLMEVRDRRFLLRTLRELESTIVVRVTSGGSWRGPAGTICYDGRCPKPEGYPPLTFYHLTDRPWEGDIRVSGGRWPIYARPVRSGGGFGGSGGGSPRRNEVRAAWLNHLAGREGSPRTSWDGDRVRALGGAATAPRKRPRHPGVGDAGLLGGGRSLRHERLAHGRGGPEPPAAATDRAGGPASG